MHEKIRYDERVTVYERKNLREVHSVGELVDLVTLECMDFSISLSNTVRATRKFASDFEGTFAEMCSQKKRAAADPLIIVDIEFSDEETR